MIDIDETSTIGETFARAVQAYGSRPFLAVPPGHIAAIIATATKSIMLRQATRKRHYALRTALKATGMVTASRCYWTTVRSIC